MSRRKTKPRLSPVWMPWLREKLADWLDAHADPSDTRQRSAFADMMRQAWSRGDALRHSPMWYVSRDMTTLAVHTALHEEPPDTDPPSPTGFILFEGGLDLGNAPDAPLAHVAALRWVSKFAGDGRRPQVSFAFFTDDRGVGMLWGCDLPLVPMPANSVGSITAGKADLFGRIMQAVWALSSEPTVCTVQSPARPAPTEPLPPKMVDTAVSQVRMIVLRENLHSPRAGDESAGAPRREYSHRFIVRGFWRNQPYGKNHEQRRRQWIPPFVKGPADKPLIAKVTVRIWRR